MTMPAPPPDTRTAGQPGHIADHNQMSDAITALETSVQALQQPGSPLSGMAVTPVQAVSVTALPWQLIPVDATTASRTVTLPSNPADGTQVAVKMVKTSGANTVTVSSGGATFNQTGATTITLVMVNQGLIAVYSAAQNIWYVSADDLPLAGMDARYVSNPMTTPGDIVYGGTSGVMTRLAGDTSNTRKFLREKSTSGVAQPPVWDTLQLGDLPAGLPRGLNLVYLDNYSPDPTGATFSDTAMAAAQSAGGAGAYLIVVGAGTYKFANSYSFGRLQGLTGQGSAFTIFNYTGSGTFLTFWDPSFSSSLSNGGRVGGFALGGYSSGTGAIAMRWGDLNRARVNDIQISGFNTTGGIGLYLHNVSGWSEQAEWTAINVVDCSTCVYFDTSSWDYSLYQFLVVANANQDGIRGENGAQGAGTRIELRGNFHAGATNTGSVIVTDKLNTSTGTTSFTDVTWDVVVECDGTAGQVGHYAIRQLGGNPASQFTGQGTLVFNAGASVAFQNGSFTGQYGFGPRVSIPGLGTMDPGDGLVVQGASQWFSSGNTSGNYAYNGMYIYPGGGDFQGYILPSGSVTIAGFYGAASNYARTRKFTVFFKQPPSGAPGLVTLPGNVVIVGANKHLSTTSNAIDAVTFTLLPGDSTWYATIDSTAGVAWAPQPTGDTTGATDLANLQAALNALPNGGTLFLPAGSIPYWINAPLVYRNGQSIRGDGHAKSSNAAIIKQAAGANMIAPTWGVNGRGIWVSGTSYAIGDGVLIPVDPNFNFYNSAVDKGNFAASTAYVVNNVVFNSGVDNLAYVNILGYTSSATTPNNDPTHWQLVSTVLYRCYAATSGTTTPDADGSHWTRVPPTALLIPYEWLNNNNFDGFPSVFENIQLDGNRTNNPYSTASGVITQNYWTDIRRCAIANMPANGILQTDTTLNGTQITNTSSENRVLENKIYNTTLDGFRISNAGATANLDGFCEDNNISGCLTGINMDRGAGWQIRGNHLYGIGGNGINVSTSFATKVIDNYLEQFGAQNVPNFFYGGIAITQLNGRGSHVSRNFVGSTDPNVNTSHYQLISVSAGVSQTAQAICVDNIMAGPASPNNSIGLALQINTGGTLNVIANQNQITSVSTKQYIQTPGVTVTSAPSDWYNVVTEFGGDASGNGDSTAAIQAAITACGNAGGGIVYFPAGTYKITPVSATVPALTVPSNVILMGAGMGATTLLKNGNGILIDFSGPGPISKTSNWNINQGLEKLSINGNSKTGLVLRLYYVQMYYERDVKIYSNNDISIDCVQLFDSRVYDGVYLYGGSTTTSTVTGAQAPFHLIRNSAAPATTLSAAVSGTITSLPVVALPAALPAGIVQVWSAGGVVQNFTTTGAAASATSIPVTSTLVTITTATGNTVNGFGWSNGNTNELKMFGCHWEDNLSGAIWITAGVNNTSLVNNIDLIGSKCEQDAIGYACPQVQVDASANGVRVSGFYFYAGGFNTGFSTPVTGIYFHPGYGSLNQLDMGNGASATISSGIDINQTSLSPSVVNLNQYWNTSPTVAGVTVGTGGVVFLNNVQIGGTVTTKISGSGSNYSVINDPNSSVAIANTLTSGAHTVFGNLDVTSVGFGLKVAEGTNAKQGTATLVAGSKVVANTSVTANSRILLTSNADGGTPGWLRVSARTAGTSFTITSSSGTDTSTVAYQIFEPG